MDVMSKRFDFFGFIAGWSIATSAETGPTFQAWTLCERLDSRFAGSPSDPDIYFAAYLVSGAPYFAGRLCIFILGLHPQGSDNLFAL